MSNNKQSMKLYTKEDFLKAAEFCEVSMIDAKYIIERIDEVTKDMEIPPNEDWSNGAKWMRDKIGGNNEQQ